MRYKQGTGDPAGFKLFMKQEGMKPSTMVRYVGNRLHVMFHLAGIIFSFHERLHYFLDKLCMCENPLRAALKKDLENPKIVVQLRSLGLIGKLLTGPWMREIYGNKNHLTNLETIPMMRSCLERLEHLKDEPSELLAAESDVFGHPLDASDDQVLSSLQTSDWSGAQKKDFSEISTLLIGGIIDVLKKQLQPYLFGELSLPTDQMLAQTKSAPTHNIFAEQTLGLTDHLYRRAPNATVGFIDGKVKSKKNKTLQWLEEQSETEQERLIKFAITTARHVRADRKERSILIKKTLGQRQVQKKMKRDTTARNKLEKKMANVIDGTVELDVEFSDCDSETLEAIRVIISKPDSLVGKRLSHMWCDDGQDIWFCGRVLELKKTYGYSGTGKGKTKNKNPTYKLEIAYWREELNEVEDDSEDFWVTLKQALTDMVCGELCILD